MKSDESFTMITGPTEHWYRLWKKKRADKQEEECKAEKTHKINH